MGLEAENRPQKEAMDALNIEIGRIPFSVELENPAMVKEIEALYKPFIIKKDSYFKIQVALQAHINRCVREGGIDISFTDGIYKIETEEFSTTLDVEKKAGRINIYSQWPKEALVSALNNLCIFLILKQGGIVLHASGVVKRKRAYLFFGPSGSGKSTVAEHSKRYAILSEESIGVMRIKNKFKAFAIPYYRDSRFMRRLNRCFEIAGLFKLVKDKTNGLRAVPKPQAVVDFLNFPDALAGIVCFADFFEAYRAFIEAVACYELHFLPDNSFWRCIDEFVN